ncbi:MAG: CocE/NonD family hydrolase [Thermoplasmatota archaeon]
MVHPAWLATVALLCVAGCAAPSSTAPQGLVAVQDRASEPFQVNTYFSHTLQPGPYGIKPGEAHLVPVTLPLTDGPANEAVAPVVSLGLFLPEGMPAGSKVPVIADIGPYYAPAHPSAAVAAVVGASDTVVTQPALRLGKFLTDNFVPHGYAVAQVSVLGTGDSTHCQDMMGLDEQAGIDAAVSWLGTQAWSNGNVSVIGRSYDGSTPWEAAATGNVHLKTIVPISGLTGLYELMWRNGSAESRGPGELQAIYFAMGFQGGPNDVQNLCPEAAQIPAEGAGSYATGSNLDEPGNPYWTDRYFFDRALQHYHGSVYLVQGLQDWNVKPHVVFPRYLAMQAHWETKGLFGQWDHMYPDRPGEHATLPAGEGKEGFPNSVRYDWAQDLLEWFDHYLKGTGPRPDLHTEIEDNQGHWRIEWGAWPNPGNWTRLDVATNFTQTSAGPPLVASGSDATQGGTGPGIVTYISRPLTALHISGLATFHVTVTPGGSGGQLFVELRDVDANVRLGHAIMDLRYASSSTPQPVVPGVPLDAKMEFEVMDSLVPAGHRLGLFVSGTGRDYLPAATAAPVLVDGGNLSLPTVPAGHGLAFTPPAWSGNASAVPQAP